jgi:hypothetical protein
MNSDSSRRSFLKKSAAAAISAPLLMSWEERALAQQRGGGAPPSDAPTVKASLPSGSIGKVKMTRLICGSNLIHGIAHSRDLLYVSPLVKHYYTDEKIMETWSVCEQNGIDTMSLHTSQALTVYQKYRAQGGRIKYLAMVVPEKNDFKVDVQRARDAGAMGAFILGNYCDHWAREGHVEWIGEMISNIKAAGMIAGVAAHSLRTVKAAEQAGIAPDFYMKTLHESNYWSKRQADQTKDVIDAATPTFGGNYWCMDAEETIAYMATIKRPWIAYKVLAAGAIQPSDGFHYAFQNGADFIAVGMFDFQVASDAGVADGVLKAIRSRSRAWEA